MKCPGQDLRYSTEDVVFDIPCPSCGRDVEFFKDEATARCPRCKHRFANPKRDLACAQWCAHAEACLGFVPNPSERDTRPPSGKGALAGRLIQTIKEAFGDRQDRLSHALLVFQHARELLPQEGGDPRIVLAATLLADIEIPENRTSPTVAKILRGLEFDDRAIDQVGTIIHALRKHEPLTTPEYAVAHDADLLARLTVRRGQFDRLPDALADQFQTASARERVKILFKTDPKSP